MKRIIIFTAIGAAVIIALIMMNKSANAGAMPMMALPNKSRELTMGGKTTWLGGGATQTRSGAGHFN